MPEALVLGAPIPAYENAMATALECSSQKQRPRTAWSRSIGERDLATASQLEPLGRSQLHAHSVVPDLCNLGFIDSCGARAAMKASRRVRQGGADRCCFRGAGTSTAHSD